MEKDSEMDCFITNWNSNYCKKKKKIWWIFFSVILFILIIIWSFILFYFLIPETSSLLHKQVLIKNIPNKTFSLLLFNLQYPELQFQTNTKNKNLKSKENITKPFHFPRISAKHQYVHIYNLFTKNKLELSTVSKFTEKSALKDNRRQLADENEKKNEHNSKYHLFSLLPTFSPTNGYYLLYYSKKKENFFLLDYLHEFEKITNPQRKEKRKIFESSSFGQAQMKEIIELSSYIYGHKNIRLPYLLQEIYMHFFIKPFNKKFPHFIIEPI